MKLKFISFMVLISHLTPIFAQESGLDEETRKLYLARLDLSNEDIMGPKDEILLNKLIQHHLIAIPFENLSMHTEPQTAIVIDRESIIKKVLKEKHGKNRGGYCYEINELFYLLLKTLGFDVSRHKAAVWAGKDPDVIPAPTHQLLLLRISDKIYLADVGFGLFNIFQAVLLPKDLEESTIFSDSQGKSISFKRVQFDPSFSSEQRDQEGFIYSRWSSRSENYERISSFSLEAFTADSFYSHNEYVQNNYKPFQDRVFFTRFNKQGNMIACVESRNKFINTSEIIEWINTQQGDSKFAIDIK